MQTPHRENRLLIAPSFLEGRFDSHAVDCPFAFTVDGRQGMTYVGWDGIGYQTALSWREGDNWTEGVVILPRTSGSDLCAHNAALTGMLRDNELYGDGRLRQVDGWYIGTFHAYPRPGYEAGSGSIGFVRSRDLLSWQRFGSVLRPENGGAWERGGLYKSWILEHDGRYHLFYNAKNQPEGRWREQTGVAISTDLQSWQRYGTEPVLRHGRPGDFDEYFASDPCVLRDGQHWIMFYFGLAADGHAREGYATSRDLLTWEKSGEILLDVGPPGSIDSTHAHKPSLICAGNRLEHYYCAVAGQPPRMVGGYEQAEMRGIARATGDPL